MKDTSGNLRRRSKQLTQTVVNRQDDRAHGCDPQCTYSRVSIAEASASMASQYGTQSHRRTLLRPTVCCYALATWLCSCYLLRSFHVSQAPCSTMKLDANALRYLDRDEWRILTAIEIGQKSVSSLFSCFQLCAHHCSGTDRLPVFCSMRLCRRYS